MGHSLGLPDLDAEAHADALMVAVLDTGERRLPTAGQARGPGDDVVALAPDDVLDAPGHNGALSALDEADTGDPATPNTSASSGPVNLPVYVAEIAAPSLDELNHEIAVVV